MKKIIKWVCIVLSIAIVLTALYFVFAFLGNPVSYLLTRLNASRYMEENFGDSHFQISKVGYNFKTGGYYAYVDSPVSQDSYFTIYTDWLGRYSYDTYDNVLNGWTTLSRLDEQYRSLVKSISPYESGIFDISICYGELRVADIFEVFSYTDENGETVHYTIDKEYGLDRSDLILDGEYDILQLGKDCGSICLYIHDPEVSIDRAAELLLEIKEYLDTNGVPFHAIDFHLCEPRNAEGQMVGEQITLFDFLYSDISADGLVNRVQQHWDIAQEHYAIQDGLKTAFSSEITQLILPSESSPVSETDTSEPTAATNSSEDFSKYYELLSFTGPERNWISCAMGCVFEKPQDIDLYYMFYLGTDGGGWQDISSESEKELIDHGFMREFDIQLMHADDIDAALQSTFGIALSDVEIPKEWYYLETENAFCSNHSDAYIVGPFTIIDVIEHKDESVEIIYNVGSYYNTKTKEFLNEANLMLTLQKNDAGQWLIISNIIA